MQSWNFSCFSKNQPLAGFFDTHNSCIKIYGRNLPTLVFPCHSFTDLCPSFPQVEFFTLEIPKYLSHSTCKTHFPPSITVLWPSLFDMLKTMKFWDIDSMLMVQPNSWGSFYPSQVCANLFLVADRIFIADLFSSRIAITLTGKLFHR